MKPLVLAATVCALSGAALAQQKPAAFVPFEMKLSDVVDLQNQLGEIPAKWSVPIINSINAKEREAQAEAAKKAASAQDSK